MASDVIDYDVGQPRSSQNPVYAGRNAVGIGHVDLLGQNRYPVLLGFFGVGFQVSRISGSQNKIEILLGEGPGNRLPHLLPDTDYHASLLFHRNLLGTYRQTAITPRQRCPRQLSSGGSRPGVLVDGRPWTVVWADERG